MSYRCDECEAVCDHRELRAVTETREVSYPHYTRRGDVYRHTHGVEIVRETRFCPACARAAGHGELADALDASQRELGVDFGASRTVFATFGASTQPSKVIVTDVLRGPGGFVINGEQQQVV